MSESELEEIVIACLQENLELSGEAVPVISGDTKPATDLDGFDSLRTLEVLISIEEQLDCELTPDKIFSVLKLEDITVRAMATAIQKIKQEGES